MKRKFSFFFGASVRYSDNEMTFSGWSVYNFGSFRSRNCPLLLGCYLLQNRFSLHFNWPLAWTSLSTSNAIHVLRVWNTSSEDSGEDDRIFFISSKDGSMSTISNRKLLISSQEDLISFMWSSFRVERDQRNQGLLASKLTN